MTERTTSTTRLVRIVHILFVTGAALHLLLVGAQPVLAGQGLDGHVLALDLHNGNASIILTVSVILIPLSILWWRPGRGTVWAPILTVLLFAAETLQLMMGMAAVFAVHIPLGVSIVLGSVVLLALPLTQQRRALRASPREPMTS